MMSNRGRRRLIALVVLMAIVGGGAALFMSIRNHSRSGLIDAARREGVAAYDRGEYEVALERLSYYLSHDHHDVEAILAYADSRARIPTVNGTHISEAIGLYRTALNLEPSLAEAQDALLPLYERAGRRMEWMELADEILERDERHVNALRLRAIGRYIDSRFDEAGRDLDRLIEIEPDEMQWRMLRLQLLRDQNVALEEVLALCDQWIANNDHEGRFHLLKAQALAASGNRAGARREAQQAAQRGADSADTLHQLVALLDVLELRSEAGEVIERAIEQFPEDVWPYDVAVRRSWQANRLDEALATIEQVLRNRDGLDRSLLRWKGLLHVLRGERELAVAALDQLEGQVAASEDDEARDQDRAWIRALRARLSLNEGNWDEALQAYRAAATIDPQDPVLNFLVGEAFMLTGEVELAAMSLERACRNDPNWLAAQLAYAEALRATGRAREAARLTRELLQRAEQPPLSLYLLFANTWLESNEPTDNLGVLDATSGRAISLIDMLQRLRGLYPRDTALRETLARAALWYNQPDVAVQIIEEELAAEPSDGELRLSLARLSMAYELGYEDALLDGAAHALGRTLGVIEATARLYARQGREQEGLRYLDQSLQALDGRDADEFSRQLARAEYLALIDHPEATQVLARLLDRPDQPAWLAARILAMPSAWKRRSLIRKAIDQLAALVGDQSPRVAMAEVEYFLTFRSNDPAGRAQAQIIVNDVLQQIPDSLTALSLMAQLYLLGDEPDYDGAISQLRRALSHHPREPELYVRLIRLLQKTGDFAAAEEYLQRLGNLTAAHPDLRRAELELLERQGDFSRIVQRLTRPGTELMTETDRLYLISRLHRAGEIGEALRRAEELLADEHASELAIWTIARLYADAGRFDDGRALIESFDAPAGRRELLLGRYCMEVGRRDQAAAHFNAALEANPEMIDAMVQLAGVHLAENRPEQAFRIAERGLGIDASNEALQTTLLTSGLLLDASHRVRAHALLDELDSEGRPHIETLRVFERAQEAGLPTPKLLEDARRLTQRHPEFLPAWRLAVVLHVQGGEVEQAIRIATEASARLPALPEPAEMAANLLAREDRLIEALQMARTWRHRSLDRSLPADVFIASVQRALDQPHAAMRQIAPHASAIIADRASQPSRATLLLHLLLATDQADEAVRLFAPLLKEDDRWRTAWLETAASLPFDAGAAALRAGEPHFLDRPASTLALASAWSSLGQRTGNGVAAAFEHADELAQRAAAQSAELATPALLIRAQAADWGGDLELAESLYRQGLAADSDNLMTLNNLAYVLVRRGENCEEAAELIARARELAPDVPETMDTQAHALLCLDRPAEAERMSREALKRRPDSADFLFTLGLALGAQSKWDDAAEILQQIDAILKERGGSNIAIGAKLNRLRESIQQERMLGVVVPADTTPVAP